MAARRDAAPPLNSRLPSRRMTRCFLVFVPGLLAAGAAIVLSSPVRGDLLVWGIDGSGWLFLAIAGAFLLLCTAVCWVAVEIATAAPRTWRTVTAYITILVVVSGVLLAAWPAFLLGALALSSEYRTIGTVDGRDLIVRQGIGLGDSSLQVGLRRGLFVEYPVTTGDTTIRNAPQSLSDWSFAVSRRDGSKGPIIIRFAFTAAGSGGTLVVSQPRAAE